MKGSDFVYEIINGLQPSKKFMFLIIQLKILNFDQNYGFKKMNFATNNLDSLPHMTQLL